VANVDMSVEESLLLLKFNVDKEAHIKLDEKKCEACKLKPCLYVCPVQNFKLEKGQLVFNWPGCLECGGCRIACEQLGMGAVRWSYPRGGFGVLFRYG